MKRRAFIRLLGGIAATWPLPARAQQSALPVLGFLAPGSAKSDAFRVADFRRGLNEAGYIEGQSVTIKYRWAESQFDRLPELAAQLVQQKVAVIVAISNASSLAAKAATATIPIVFAVGGDPVQLGLVASFNQPGTDATGVSFFTLALETKKMELLRKLVPAASVIAVLINPTGPNAKLTLSDIQAAANAVGQKIAVVNASDEGDFDTALATAVRLGASALFIGADPLFTAGRDQLASLIA